MYIMTNNRLINRCLRGERRADSRQHRDDHLDDLAPQALLFLIHNLFNYKLLLLILSHRGVAVPRLLNQTMSGFSGSGSGGAISPVA